MILRTCDSCDQLEVSAGMDRKLIPSGGGESPVRLLAGGEKMFESSFETSV